MLSNLRIENIAVIEKADISFDVGLNVLTGETGAGKSIIIDSLSAILGERTSKELIRTGQKNASVTAYFENVSENVMGKLRELDVLAEEDSTLLISRKIFSDGRNVCKINGCPVTVSMLKELGRFLINIHGQNDSRLLLSNENHALILDSIADNENLISEYQNYYKAYVSLKKMIKTITSDEQEKQKEYNFLTEQKNELEKADIKVGEIDFLKEYIIKSRNFEKIASAINKCTNLLSGDENRNGVVIEIKNAAETLSDVSNINDELKSDAERINEAAYILEEINSELERKLSNISFNPAELEKNEERLDFLLKLERKYGDEQTMLKILKDTEKQLDNFENSQEDIEEITNKLNYNAEKMLDYAEKITVSRKKAGEVFVKRLSEELKYLDMPDVSFKISIDDKPLNMRGKDNVEILLSANAGESEKSLSKTASGGEMSRIMLAIKNITSSKNEVGTMIFDEIDAGISGKTAEKVGIKLHDVSSGKQVICVTHSAQVASKGDKHLLIEKSTFDGKTYTQVRALGDKERKYELARIIGGVVITQGQLKVAEEMLKGDHDGTKED